MGAPIKEVITPTGRRMGAMIILASVSETRSKNAPNRVEIGIKNL
jgi:hypothetical protein